MSLIISELVYAVYSFFTVILIFLGLIAIYIYYKDVVVHDRMKGKLESLLQDVYFDKESVLNFYKKHEEQLKD